MELMFSPKEEDLKRFLLQNGKIFSARRIDRLRIQITAFSRTGALFRCVLDLKSRYIRKLREKCWDLLQTPYIVELPNDHPVEDEFVNMNYTVSQPNHQRVIALRYEEPANTQDSTTPKKSNLKKMKRKRVHNISHLLEDEESYCCQNCYKHFSRKWNLERHAATCVDEAILYRCPTCFKKYHKPSYFAAHIKSHNEPATSSPHVDEYTHNSPVNDQAKIVEENNSSFAIPYEFGAFL